MGTAKRFDRVLYGELGIHAAWLPVTNSFAVGDYGLISEGVFHKLGNVGEFGVTVEAEDGEPTRLRFRSDGVRLRRLVGGVEVDVFPDSDIDAKLAVEFGDEHSFFVSAALGVRSMSSVAAVGRALRSADGWNRRYRVVSAVYRGQDCTVVSARRASSSVEIEGRADALRLLELGEASAGLTLSSTSDVGLDVVGATGVVGLRLFRLRRFGDGVRVLGPGDDGDEVVEPDDAPDLADDV